MQQYKEHQKEALLELYVAYLQKSASRISELKIVPNAGKQSILNLKIEKLTIVSLFMS